MRGVLVLFLCVWLAACGGEPERVVVASFEAREIVVDLLEVEAAWAQDEEPRLGELCPAPTDAGRDGADMPAILLAPGESFTFAVPEVDGLWFTGALGVHFDATQKLQRPTVRLGFVVEVDGEAVLSEENQLRRSPTPRMSEWRRLGAEAGEPGIPVPAGARVRVRCVANGQEGPVADWPEDFLCGLGKPRLERVRQLQSEAPSVERPSLILVVQDTLRADRLSLSGYGKPTSPRLDQLAARGLVFDNAHAAASWTWPSTASLMTGLPVELHGVVDASACHLSTAHWTLAEVLQAQGVRTAAFSGNAIVVPGKNLDQGFEHFDAKRGSFRKSEELMPAAIEWVRAHAGERFFLYLQLVDPHWPYRVPADVPAELDADPPAEWYDFNFAEECRRSWYQEESEASPAVRSYLSDAYDASVWDGDRWLGALLDELEQLGLSDSTVVAFTSDHGEEFYEHGGLSHGHALYDEVVRVPLVLAGPGLPAGQRVDRAVSNVDLPGTLARLMGAAMPGEAGRGDLLQGATDQPIHFSTAHGFWDGRGRREITGVLHEGWVLHADEAATVSADDNRGLRLYSLEQDPAQERNLAREQPQRAAALHALIERQRARRGEGAGIGAGSATMGVLEDIGYIDGADEE